MCKDEQGQTKLKPRLDKALGDLETERKDVKQAKAGHKALAGSSMAVILAHLHTWCRAGVKSIYGDTHEFVRLNGISS